MALIVTDQRMPGMTGVELLERARPLAPVAKQLLLTAYADTDAAIRAVNTIGLDHYLLKPWDPPAELLFPVVDDLLDDWRRQHPEVTSQVRVVGHRWSEAAHATNTFLVRNHVPYRWVDVEQEEMGAQLLAAAGVSEPGDLPLVVLPDGAALRAPSAVELATSLGLRTRAEQPLYDVCIVGGGPAGLASAVYAASEGLRTVIVEGRRRAVRPGRALPSRTTWASRGGWVTGYARAACKWCASMTRCRASTGSPAISTRCGPISSAMPSTH